MKKFSLMVVLLFSSTVFAVSQQINDKPKLIVGIMVDQMKQEYLVRFYDHFGEGGFKRFVEQGFVARNGHYNYAGTSTGPGHASVYTGTTPSVHGIVGNSWYSRLLKRSVYCAEDTTVRAIGGIPRNGRISPANLYASTITDELKLFTQKRGKVIAMSIKDRGSALPGGHLSDGSYWFDPGTGNFMTSSYYMDALPNWAQAFNDLKKAKEYLSGSWDPAKPLAAYVESGPDDSPYERGFRGKDTPTLPYDLGTLIQQNGGYRMLPSTPYGNTILADFALAAVKGEDLGADEITDFLAVSFSSTDYIGHNFGPQSKEIQDTYIKLDQELARLFKELDQTVGAGNYTVFLSADHAVAENSKRMKDDGFRADNFDYRGFGEYLTAAVNEKYGEGEWLERASTNAFINRPLIAEKGLDLYKMQIFLAEKAMEYPGVHMALTGRDLLRQSYDRGIKKLIQNNYHTKESGDIFAVLDPAWQGGGSKGTGHGNPWTYDTHVPIMFYGWGIAKGSSVREIHITDIAPTVSMLLNMRLPNGATGQPIVEVFK